MKAMSDYTTNAAGVDTPRNKNGFALLRLIFNDGDHLELRWIGEERGKARSTFRRMSATLGSDDSLGAWIEAHDKSGGCYFGAAPRSRIFGSGKGGAAVDSDVNFTRALWVDLDLAGLTVEEVVEHAREAIRKAGVPAPTALVHSGGGVHAWWRLTEPLDAADIKPRLTGLARAIGSDDSVVNPSRVMRLPGSFNHRRGRACEIVEIDADHVYDIEAFPAPVEAVEADYSSLALADDDIDPDFNNLCRKTQLFLTIDRIPEGGGGTEWAGRNAALIAAAIDFRANNFSIEDALRILGDERAISRDGLPRDEAYRTIRNAYRRADAKPSRLPVAYPVDTDFDELLRLTNHDAPFSLVEWEAVDVGDGDDEDSPLPRLGGLVVPATLEAGAEPGAEPGAEGGEAVAEARPKHKARIRVVPGQIAPIVDAATAALQASGAPIYQRGGELVRVVELEATEARDGVIRQAGTISIHPVSAHWLVEQMSVAATWVAPSAKKDVLADPPHKYARHLLARVGDWPFAHLRGIVNAPTLRADGSILDAEGYDAETKLIADFGGVEFPPIPRRPTKADALAALEQFDPLFAGFPFASEADRSVLYAAILTALIRRTLPTAPLFAFSAPVAGSGKSKLTDCAAIFQTGRKAAFASQGKSEEEDEKRLSSMLRAGDASIVLDNCERPLDGDFLCAMLTSELVQARILGKSERMVLPTNVTMMASGNNLGIAGDLCRRTLVCRLDAQVERPDRRQFTFDPVRVARERRAELVAAGLTALRAYISAGRPHSSLARIGSFEDWNVVRETLCWLGRADPIETRERIFRADPRREDVADTLAAWIAAFGSEPLTVSEVRERSLAAGEIPAVYDLLSEKARGRRWSTRSVGRWLSRHRDTIVAGLQLTQDGETRGAARWSVRRAS